jgi:hypothetical protein
MIDLADIIGAAIICFFAAVVLTLLLRKDRDG